MDGNGRWAQARHRPRVFGHRAGVETVRRIVEDAGDLGIKYLTLYSFSTENWTRPKVEISALFNLLKEYVESDLKKLDESDVRIRVLGSRDGLQSDLIKVIEKAEQTTKDNQSFHLNIAFNYGGRDEVVRAVKRAIQDGVSPSELSEEVISRYLDSAGLPEPDLIIRTSGEKRTSNFLLWQAAYSEFVFTDVLWPDFKKSDLEAAVLEFQSRNRRYGAVGTAEVA
jgi:undecaprenyl diphosphate synthase